MSETAVYVVIRRDLKMRRGKEIAQGIHAVAKLGYVQGVPLIVLQVENLLELAILMTEASSAGVSTVATRDAGRTEVEPGTITAAAIGPVVKGRLPMLSATKLY